MSIGRAAVWWGGLAAGLMIVALLTLGAGGWPGGPDQCLAHVPDTCYCENYSRPDPFKQPANTWSNLGFVAAGLLILRRLDRTRLAHTPANPMQARTFYSFTYGAVVLFLGPASMAFHGSLRQWGGWIDLFSMMLYATFLLLYDVARIRRWPVATFVAWYVPVVMIEGLINAAAPKSGQIIFGLSIFAVVVLQILVQAGRVPRVRRPGWGWFAGGLGLFLLAYAGIWLWSNTSGPLCDPNSLLQGHAAWHLLCAGSTLLFYRYLWSEEANPAVSR
jgi:hypothetical protein